MNKKIVYIIIAVIVIVSTFVGYKYYIYQTKNTNGLEKVSLRLKWIDQAQFAGYYLANSRGLYSDKNLEVEIHPGGSDISPVQMVATGVDDFGITGADQIILAREKGVPLVALAVLYKDSPVTIMSLATKDIVKPKDLEGRKVEVVYGRDEEAIYRILLEREGVNTQKINEVPSLADYSRVISGQVDARVDYELNGGILLPLKGFPLNLIKPRDYGINFYADTLFTTEEIIRKNPEMVRNFVKASVEGWKVALKDQKSAIDEVMRINNSLDREHQSKFLEYSIPMITGKGDIGYSEKKTWEEMQTMLLSQGVLKNTVDIDKVFTNEFLK
ncbi:MAG: ABC transporter substrate-binding protein [Nanoarchaeota archaeon]|nr:ABC transporter substrate-binding protein [Patescibacteria group bacterium]MBU4124529.1 ABC transporter substrate-binding protein [Nanoarchaeota archaeon]